MQPMLLPKLPIQFAKLALVIVATAALSTVTPRDVEVHDDDVPSAGMENLRLFVSILPSLVPTGNQLAADATDGNTNAHNAITAPKSNMLFFKSIFNISQHS
ncbi:MAG: hypothetical protein ABW167_03935 [Baekduia sp.]